MKKIIRVVTHLGSLNNLLQGQLRFVSTHYNMIGVGSKGEPIDGQSIIEKLIQRENTRIIPVEMTRQITPIKDILALYHLYKVFKKEKPLIVHSHTPKAGTLAMIAAKIAGVPHRLHDIAGLPLVEATGIKRRILNTVEKITYSFATKIYPNSFGLQDIIIDNNFTDRKKMKVLGVGSSNGVNTSHFDPSLYSKESNIKLREELSINKLDFLFIFLGRIVRDKGINELVNAFKQLAEKHNHTKLLLVGYYDPLTAELLPETIAEININKNIIVLNWQDDVRPFLSISNVLAFPSYREGFPNTVLEASAMKTPSIVADINGCNEIITDGLNGTIVPVKNTEALQSGMERLLLDTKYYEHLIDNSRTSICENYEQKDIWELILAEYNELTKNEK
ncbi:MAG: glycosyltransferase family 4 protein [Polaribacter sp.]